MSVREPHAWPAKPPASESPVHPAASHPTTNSHNHLPTPFPEGELFDSPGFAAQRLPWVRAIHNTHEPQRGSLTWESRKPPSSISLRTPVRWVEFRPYLSSAARVKPALSGLSRSGGPVTQGSAAHEPWAMKECPFRTWLGGTLLMRAGRSVTQIDRGADQSGFVLCPLVRGSSDECPAGGHRGPRGCGTGLSACSSKRRG